MTFDEENYDFEIILPSFFYTNDRILQGVEDYRNNIEKTSIASGMMPDITSENANSLSDDDKQKIINFYSAIINTENNLVETLQVIAENTLKDEWILQYINDTKKIADEIFRAQMLKRIGIDTDSKTLMETARRNKNTLKVVLESIKEIGLCK